MWPLLLALALSILPRTGPAADAILGAAEARVLDLVYITGVFAATTR